MKTKIYSEFWKILHQTFHARGFETIYGTLRPIKDDFYFCKIKIYGLSLRAEKKDVFKLLYLHTRLSE